MLRRFRQNNIFYMTDNMMSDQFSIFRFNVPVFEPLVQWYKAFGDTDNQEIMSSDPELCNF